MAGLMISRKPGQTVIIEASGMALLLNIEEAKNGRVILNFLGPRDVHIWRGEFFASIKGFDKYDRLIVEAKEEGGKDAHAFTLIG